MKALVIGANGFLGQHIVALSLKNKWNIDCVYNQNSGNIPKGIHAIPSKKLLTLKDEYNVVFLLAAAIPYPTRTATKKRLNDTNVLLPKHIHQKFSKSKIVFSSSTAVYGIPSGVITEKTKFSYPDAYGRSKILAEEIIKDHVNYAIVRFSSLYGKGMYPHTFLPTIVRDAKEKGTITLYGSGSRKQDYLHVTDAARILMLAAKTKLPDIYLGVFGKSYTNLDVALLVQEHTKGCTINHVGSDNSPSFLYDNSQTKQKLDFNPRVSLSKGINTLITS